MVVVCVMTEAGERARYERARVRVRGMGHGAYLWLATMTLMALVSRKNRSCAICINGVQGTVNEELRGREEVFVFIYLVVLT